MPFTKAESQGQNLSKDDLDYIYDLIKRSVESFEMDDKKYFQQVLRYEDKVGSIISGIVQKLKDSDLVIADLTGVNPNVMYELGVRHSLKRGTIMLTQDFDEFPSDLRDYMAMEYDYTRSDFLKQKINEEKFSQELHHYMNQIFNTKKMDSPVLEYVQRRELYRSEEEINTIKENAVIFESIMEDFDELSDIFSQQFSEEESIPEKLKFELANLKLSAITSKFGELRIPVHSTILYQEINIAEVLIGEIGKKFMMTDSYENFLSGIFEGEMPSNKFKDVVLEQMVDPFSLQFGDSELKFTDTQKVFDKSGLLVSEVFIGIKEYLETSAEKFGIQKEIDDLLVK